jgi:serine/threonine protein phosphatase 1
MAVIDKTYAVADIHGAHKALVQVLERSGFDYDKDKLICLGDTVDGWSEVIESIRELAKIKNLVYVMGNHDKWFVDFVRFDIAPYVWVSQGGRASIDSYKKYYTEELTDELIKFFDKGVYFYEEDERLYVHGGFNWHRDVRDQMPSDLMWDRHLWATANMWAEWEGKGLESNMVKSYNEVFIGHTSTCFENPDMKPVNHVNVWNLDQGAGYEGKLTIMNVDTKEYWQSDIVSELYPEEKGRR